jgi:hypothetical protein
MIVESWDDDDDDDETSKQTHTYISSNLDFLFENELYVWILQQKSEMSYWVALFVITLIQVRVGGWLNLLAT